MITETPKDEFRFPCEQCGSDLRYSPETGLLTCDHCGFSEEHSGSGAPQIIELDFDDAVSRNLPLSETFSHRVTNCTNCGAQIAFDGNTHADECPFCATPVVVDTGEQRHIKPKAILPFALDERSAHTAMENWLGRLWFAPNGLKQYARKGRKMQGVYVPYWTFDAQTHSSYTGARGTEYTESHSVVVNGKRQRRTVIKVRWSRASGRVKRFFDDVLVLASSSLPRSQSEGLLPWELAELEPYNPKYLAGFIAESYTVGLEPGLAIAKEKMARQILRDVRFDIGGDRQRVDRVETRHSDVTFKHILLPIWIAAYKYRGETYRFIVNGQSGKVQGERPYSVWKILGASVLVAILLFLLIFFNSAG